MVEKNKDGINEITFDVEKPFRVYINNDEYKYFANKFDALRHADDNSEYCETLGVDGKWHTIIYDWGE